MRARAATVLVAPLALTLAACPRALHVRADPHAPCATLDANACARARALVVAASTYADEQHDLVLTSGRPLAPGSGLLRTAQGWREMPASCAIADPVASAPPLSPAVPASKTATPGVDYAFVGVSVDGALVSADADLGPFLGAAPDAHEVRLLAIALTSAPPRAWSAGPSLVVNAADDSCTCEGASHFAGPVRYGATLAFTLRAPRDGTHVHAVDFVTAALGDPRFAARESNDGLVIDGLEPLLDGLARPLAFHVTSASPVPVAVEAAPLDDVCGFAAPAVTPSPVDFGIASYGASSTRSVHVVNRAPIDLEAIVGARTVPLPARAAIDLALRWTPDGDATRCETQTRDESILFLPAWRDRSHDASAPDGRRARVLETIRTGKPHVERVERFEEDAREAHDPAKGPRSSRCPRDYKVTSCRAENAVFGAGDGGVTAGYTTSAAPRGDDGCLFSCREPASASAFCRFDAVMDCALACP